MTSKSVQRSSLSGLHLLLTYECNFECDHCFVWGGPSKDGTMTREIIQQILGQAEGLGTIEWIYFEGGEPFLFYDLLRFGVEAAHRRGFKVGIVSNAGWAKSNAEAMQLLQPFAGIVEDLSISDDPYHGADDEPLHTKIARRAAEKLGIPVDFISVAGEELADTVPQPSSVLYRGRAADKLAAKARPKPWQQFNECPWEALRFPKRVHVDAFGFLHVCQGISIGNLRRAPLARIMRDYDPDTHPVVGPLLAGGPVELVKRYDLPVETAYADACHLCYSSRCKLRDRFANVLTPDQMYGMTDSGP